MNLQITQLAADYKHPSGVNMGGYWAIVENGRVIATDKNRSNLELAPGLAETRIAAAA